MAENYLIGMAEGIKSYIPGTSSIEEGDSKITINAELKTGIKGISVAIECAPNTVKIKGTQEYKYPISEEAVEEFQQEMMEKYSGCNVYVSGQVFAFSKFFSYQTVEEAVKTTEEIIDAMQDAVVTFENDCVNFLEKDVEAKEEDYNPEENVNLVHVDNAYHAVSTTMQDTEDYEEEHRKFAEKIFRDLAAEIGGTLNGNEVILTDEKEKITTDCIFFPLDAEILVSVSTPADNDAGTIYVSYINANYPELMAAYDADNEVFKVRTYSSPDKYAPDETKERLDLCRTALIACMKEYERTLKKKDSADFASDVQQILSEQTAMVSEREKAVAERENEMEQKEKEMQKKEAELQKQVAVLEEERAALQEKIKSEEAKVKEHEEEMQNKIKEYEERDTKNILNLQQLAKQLAALQDRIDLGTVFPDLKVQVRAGAVTGASYIADHLARGYGGALGNRQAAHMSVKSGNAAAMVDHKISAVAAAPAARAGKDNRAVGRRHHRRTVDSAAGDINGSVVIGAPVLVPFGG